MIAELATRYPSIAFKPGKTFMWSPQEKSIMYDPKRVEKDSGIWSLLHEIGHAIANHQSFDTDLELIKLELEAWRYARQIGESLDVVIDEGHIQDCLDSYRDWIHARSRCPECSQINPQTESGRYACFNCQTRWKVSGSQLCSVRSREK